jgi:glycosyltransferase involved in cell wall biosynthesis
LIKGVGLSKVKDNVKVSVIVPVYNLEQYVEACIKGLAEQQTRFLFEVIAVDDCSTDRSFAILQRLARDYPSVLKLYQNNSNSGLAKTMKRLLSLTSGDYIAYLDGDDIALPGKLQAQADYLDNHPGCTTVYHESDVFDSDTDETLWTYTQDYYNRDYIPQSATVEHVIRYGCFMQAGTVMVRRHQHMIDAVDEGNKILLDHPWHVLNLLYGGGTIDFIDQVYGRYRIHSNSFGAQTKRSYKRREQVLKDQLHVCDLCRPFGVDDAVIQAGKRHYYYATALYFLKLNEDELFRDYLSQSSDGQWFFNDKHQAIWQGKKDCQRLRQQYF